LGDDADQHITISDRAWWRTVHSMESTSDARQR
jgi:hypothetical protein